MEVRSHLPAGADRPTFRPSPLAARVSGDTAVYVEVPAVGQGINKLVTQLKSDPSFEEGMGASLGQVEGLLGTGLEDYLDWLGDAAIAVELSGDTPTGGLLGTVSDSDTADRRLTQLVTLLKLAGMSGGQVSVSESDHAGVTITTIKIDTAATGVDAPVSEVGISFALKGDLFVLSPDKSFVEKTLDGPGSATLAASPRFSEAVTAAGGPNVAQLTYVDLAAIREFATGVLPAVERDRYERDIKPYLEPLDVLVGANVQGGPDEVLNRTLLIVK
jgi:hypothetical protein